MIGTVVFLFILQGCSHTPKSAFANEPESIPFSYVQEDFIVLPATLEDSVNGKFVFDTGIGINLISLSVCERLHCKITGSFIGKRMSGQTLTIPTAHVRSLSVGHHRVTDATVGVMDMEQFFPGKRIDGFISLSVFKNQAFTVDYRNHFLKLETQESLAEVKRMGLSAPIKFKTENGELDILISVKLPNGVPITVLVDSGSQVPILDERFMKDLNINPSSKDVVIRKGKDETGHEYSRYFAYLNGRMTLTPQPSIGIDSPKVMFQKIIYDGLIGYYFLREFNVTFDLPNSELVFRKP